MTDLVRLDLHLLRVFDFLARDATPAEAAP